MLKVLQKKESCEAIVVKNIEIDLQIEDVTEGLGKLKHKETVLSSLSAVLAESAKTWRPEIVYRWMNCVKKKDGIELSCQVTRECVTLSLGQSCGFAHPADKAMIGVYTVGRDLERIAAEKSSQGQMFDSYLFESVALALLKKLQRKVCIIAEETAKEREWGVGPFLSPGSVHGWELEEQLRLCPLLPLFKIDVDLQDNGILVPFKSVSFLIGAGKDYSHDTVGSACRVCSMKDTCQVRKLRG